MQTKTDALNIFKNPLHRVRKHLFFFSFSVKELWKRETVSASVQHAFKRQLFTKFRKNGDPQHNEIHTQQ